MHELLDASAVTLARWIRERKLSPVELLDALIARIADVNPAINAVIAERHDAARAEARAAERRVMHDPPESLPPLLGLPYTATYKSAKLVFGGAYGPTLMQRKIFKKLGILARNLHSRSLRYGDASGAMYAMPAVEDGKPVAANTVWDDYDKDMLPVDGVWSTDSRIRLTAQAPLPATVLALVAPVESNERV